MKRAGIVVTLVLAVAIFACSFGTVSAALSVVQPYNTSAHATEQFVVQPGDSATSVGNRLANQHLINNALAFRLLARYRSLTIKTGVYKLSPSMTMDDIIAELSHGQSVKQVSIQVPPGLRVAQYPALFSSLPNFNAKKFLQIANTGKFEDGTPVSKKYWFVPDLQKNATVALEGYLYPDTYFFAVDNNEQDVINRLLTTFGEKLCPGPTSQPSAYVTDQAQCKAHAATYNGTNIFTALEAKYFTTNDTMALYDALTIASIVMREVNTAPNIIKVSNLYYSRWLVSQGKLDQPYDSGQGQTDVVDYLGADPTAQYARDTDHPPADGKYWQPLQDTAVNTDPNNPYNTNVATHKGLPPGPISAPANTTDRPYLYAATTADGAGTYFYFFTSCGTAYYSKTYSAFLGLQQQHPPQASC